MTDTAFLEITSATFTSRNVRKLWEANKNLFSVENIEVEHWMDVYDPFVGRGKVMFIPHPLEVDENDLVSKGSFCRLVAAVRVGLERLPVRVTCKPDSSSTHGE